MEHLSRRKVNAERTSGGITTRLLWRGVGDDAGRCTDRPLTLSLSGGRALRYARMAVATLWYYQAYDRQEERPMYCPNCAAQFEETQKYCRSCGTDVNLVSQALKGQLPSKGAVGRHRGHSGRLRERRREDKQHPSIEGAVRAFFTGLGFVFVSFAAREFAPAGKIWWFWLLIPAFSCMGAGIGQFLKLRGQHRQQQVSQFDSKTSQPTFTSPTTRMPEIPAPTTSEPPSLSSVTEHTTKHLDPSRSN